MLVDPKIMTAIAEFTKQVAVPILYDDAAGVDQVGTGTLFTIGPRCFLVTAAHLFEGTDPAQFAIPSNPVNDPAPSTLGRYHLFEPEQEFVDIAVLELLESSLIEKLSSGWRILTLANTGHASSQGVFALCGYPSARAKRVGSHLIGGSLVTAYSERMLEIPEDAEEPVHPELDLFFYYDSEATDIDGKTINTPQLGGTSGAAVWEYCESDSATFWTPEQAFTVVGVQSSFLSGQYFRAKSWSFVLKILREADEELAAAIDMFERQRLADKSASV